MAGHGQCIIFLKLDLGGIKHVDQHLSLSVSLSLSLSVSLSLSLSVFSLSLPLLQYVLLLAVLQSVTSVSYQVDVNAVN